MLAVFLGLPVQWARGATPYPIVATPYSTTYSAYNPTGSSSITFKIQYYSPDSTVFGDFPVLIILSGTSGSAGCGYNCEYASDWATTIAQGMAQRGVIAAMVQYDNWAGHHCGCDGVRTGRVLGVTVDCSPQFDTCADKAKAIFDNGNAKSALRRIISHSASHTAKAKLAQGIVVAGHSQGTFVGHLAEGFTTRSGLTLGKSVTAAFFTGTGVESWGYPTSSPYPFPLPCDANGVAGSIPGNKIRAFNGEVDASFGGGETPTRQGERDSLQAVTGMCSGSTGNTCSDGTNNGGGWRLVLNSFVTDGKAEHRFMFINNGFDLDPKWVQGYDGQPLTRPWTLPLNLNWLARKLGSPAIELP
jgi:hypothetical protein